MRSMSATADIVLSILPCFLGLLHRTLADTLLALLGTGLPAPLLLGQCHANYQPLNADESRIHLNANHNRFA